MGTAGFTMPGVLFLGSIDSNIRGFLAEVLPALKARGYTRVVEPCAGALAISNLAGHLGFDPRRIEASDVSLFSALVGAAVAGDPLDALDIRVDGEPLALPDADLVDQVAFALWTQMVLRMEAKAHIPYWADLVDEARASETEQRQQIAKSLRALHQRLAGMTYRSMDLFDHMDAVADDPHTVIVASPPTYTAGYERFFDTAGRLTWAEPTYGVFDPATSQQDLYERYADAKALTILYEEAEPRQHVCPVPLFAQSMGQVKNNYLGSNRPDEVFAITGGPRVAVRQRQGIEPSDYPILPYDRPITAQSTIQVLPVGSQVADYYRNVWLHRLVANPGDMNLLLVVDGYAAGVLGYSTKLMAGFRSQAGELLHDDKTLLRFAAGAPHDTLRLTRLASMVALQKHVAFLAAGPKTGIFVAASDGLVTMESTRHPEAKGQRGLMKLFSRVKGPDGYKLVYTAPWQDKPLEAVLVEFLTKESRWRASSTKN